MDTFDVVIVGARCAGSPLATVLSRAGLQLKVWLTAHASRGKPRRRM